MEEVEIIGASIGFAVILLRYFASRFVAVARIYNVFLTVLEFIPFVREVLEFIRDRAEEYRLYRLKAEIEKLLPALYVIAENTISGGEKKREFVAREIVAALSRKDPEGFQRHADELGDVVRKWIEILNYKQKHGIVFPSLDFVVQKPVLGFVFDIIRRAIGWK